MTKPRMCAVLVACIMSACMLPSIALQAKDIPQKKAMVIVAFGTTVPEAQRAMDQVDRQVREAFPHTEVRWAYTSQKVREKLRREGKKLDPPMTVLADLLEHGYTHIMVASFHTLPGEEFHDLHREVQAFRDMAGSSAIRLMLSRPLLSSRENMEAVAKAMLGQVPADRNAHDAVVLMGHGSANHPGDAVYAALNFYLLDMDPNAYVATVAGNPKIGDVIPRLKTKQVKKVYLMPFMAVAGEHARKDLCGDDPESWKSILSKEGFQVACILKGTAENPEIVKVWLNNIRQAYEQDR